MTRIGKFGLKRFGTFAPVFALKMIKSMKTVEFREI